MTRLLTLTLLLVLFTGALPAFADSVAFLPRITGIPYVTVTVDDQDAAREWYIAALDCQVAMDFPYGAEGERWLAMKLPVDDPGTPQIVLWKPSASEREEVDFPPAPVSNILLATDDCAGMTAHLEANGAAILQQPENVGYGIQSIWKDPFGNQFVMVQYLSRATASPDVPE